jgi:hypothetical protein
MRRTAGMLVAILAGSMVGVGVARVDPAEAAISTIDLVTPAGSAQFGYEVFVLTNGNFVVTDPYADGSRGAVHLYDGASNALISTLRGSTPAT